MDQERTRQRIVLSQPVVARQDGRLAVDCALGSERRLHISIDGPSDVLDGIRPDLTAFLPMAMLIAGREGKDVVCDGPLDATYLLNLNTSFAPLASAFFGGHSVEVTLKSGTGATASPSLASLHKRSARLGLLFSAGVDSFYSLAKFRQFNTAPDYLINVNAGSQDRNPRCWAARLANIAEVAAKLDVPLLTLDTNFHELFDEPHLRCHTIRNLCVCFALRPWVEAFGYSSSSDYQAVSFVDAFTDGISFIDHIVSVSMTPRQLEVLHLGFNATRLEKTKAIVSDPVVQAHLDVCTNGLYQGRKDASSPINCGICDKCVRTIITLDHLGHLDAFQTCFDLAHYRSNRAALVTRLLESSQPLDREAAALLAT